MKRFLSSLLVLSLWIALAIPALAAAPTFTDVPTTHWAYSYIEEMAEKGIMDGVGNGRFAPTQELSTAEFATMIARAFWPNALSEYTVDERFFENPSAWWVPYVGLVDWKNGLLNTVAYSEMQNHPSNGGTGLYVYQWGNYVTEPISRYDMASMIYNLMTAKQVSLPTASEQTAARSQINDWDHVPPLYQTAVSVSYAAGILNGKDGGLFAGSDTMTRAEAAAVISRLLAKGIGPDQASVTPAPTSPTPSPAAGGEKDADGYTTANSVNSVKPSVGKSDAYKTKGGGNMILSNYDPNGNYGDQDYYEVVTATQTVSNNVIITSFIT